MAAPNILSITTVSAKTIGNTVPLTATAFLTNGSGSGQVYKINTVMVTNSNSVPVAVTLDFYRASVSSFIGYNITVPSNATVVLLAKDSAIYLEEADSLRSNASAAGLYTVTSYEVIS